MTKDYVFNGFNTRRLYTEAGQRIAWTTLSSGHAYMVDIDRGIDYILVPIIGEVWSNKNVLDAYDNAREAQAKYNREEFLEAQAVRSRVTAFASQIQPVRSAQRIKE